MAQGRIEYRLQRIWRAGMKDRFDLEHEINCLYSFGENLKTLNEGVIEQNLSNDEIANAIEGIRVLLDLHTNKLLDTMSQCFKLDGYNDSKII